MTLTSLMPRIVVQDEKEEGHFSLSPWPLKMSDASTSRYTQQFKRDAVALVGGLGVFSKAKLSILGLLIP